MFINSWRERRRDTEREGERGSHVAQSACSTFSPAFINKLCVTLSIYEVCSHFVCCWPFVLTIVGVAALPSDPIREEMNASLNAVVSDISKKIKEQEEERLAQDGENSSLRSDLQVHLNLFSTSFTGTRNSTYNDDNPAR